MSHFEYNNMHLKIYDCLSFSFSFLSQFSSGYVGQLSSFVAGIYILPFRWLNSGFIKGEIVAMLVERTVSWEEKRKKIHYCRPHMALISDYYLAIM